MVVISQGECENSTPVSTLTNSTALLLPHVFTSALHLAVGLTI